MQLCKSFGNFFSASTNSPLLPRLTLGHGISLLGAAWACCLGLSAAASVSLTGVTRRLPEPQRVVVWTITARDAQTAAAMRAALWRQLERSAAYDPVVTEESNRAVQQALAEQAGGMSVDALRQAASRLGARYVVFGRLQIAAQKTELVCSIIDVRSGVRDEATVAVAPGSPATAALAVQMARLISVGEELAVRRACGQFCSAAGSPARLLPALTPSVTLTRRGRRVRMVTRNQFVTETWLDHRGALRATWDIEPLAVAFDSNATARVDAILTEAISSATRLRNIPAGAPLRSTVLRCQIMMSRGQESWLVSGLDVVELVSHRDFVVGGLPMGPSPLTSPLGGLPTR